jgi:hypothetical protein
LALVGLAGCGTARPPRSTTGTTRTPTARERAETVCGDLRARLEGIAKETAETRDIQPATLKGRQFPRRLERAIKEDRTVLYAAMEALEEIPAAGRARLAVSEGIEGFDRLSQRLPNSDPRTPAAETKLLIAYARPQYLTAGRCVAAAESL